MQEGSSATRDKTPISERAAVVSYSSWVESVNCVRVGFSKCDTDALKPQMSTLPPGGLMTKSTFCMKKVS